MERRSSLPAGKRREVRETLERRRGVVCGTTGGRGEEVRRGVRKTSNGVAERSIRILSPASTCAARLRVPGRPAERARSKSQGRQPRRSLSSTTLDPSADSAVMHGAPARRVPRARETRVAPRWTREHAPRESARAHACDGPACMICYRRSRGCSAIDQRTRGL